MARAYEKVPAAAVNGKGKRIVSFALLRRSYLDPRACTVRRQYLWKGADRAEVTSNLCVFQKTAVGWRMVSGVRALSMSLSSSVLICTHMSECT